MARSNAEGVGLPPTEAIAFFRQKVNSTTEHWTDVWNEGHSRAFMVAGAASEALVDDFRRAVAKALEQGTTLAQFRADFDEIVARNGWTYNGSAAWRSQIIYETNLSTAYSAGRYAEMTEPDTLAAFPYWQYVRTGSLNPRKEHLAWVGTVLRADDPWWRTHYPPNGWKCRCRVEAISARELGHMGKSGPDPSLPVDLRPWRNPRTGEVTQVPNGIDPGFGYNPGEAWKRGTPPPAGAPPIPPVPGSPSPPRPPRLPPAEAVSPPAMPVPAGALVPSNAAPDYAQWAQRIIESGRPDGTMRVVGRIPPRTMEWLRERALAPETDSLAITAAQVRHISRDVKVDRSTAIAAADIRRLPELLANPGAVLRDIRDGALVMVFTPSDPDEERAGKLVIEFAMVTTVIEQGVRRRMLLNAVKSAGLVPAAELRIRRRYELIEGEV